MYEECHEFTVCCFLWQSHVPLWLQSTRLYRWPKDAKDLLLRLLREEKYIVPPLGKELMLTIKPL